MAPVLGTQSAGDMEPAASVVCPRGHIRHPRPAPLPPYVPMGQWVQPAEEELVHGGQRRRMRHAPEQRPPPQSIARATPLAWAHWMSASVAATSLPASPHVTFAPNTSVPPSICTPAPASGPPKAALSSSVTSGPSVRVEPGPTYTPPPCVAALRRKAEPLSTAPVAPFTSESAPPRTPAGARQSKMCVM